MEEVGVGGPMSDAMEEWRQFVNHLPDLPEEGTTAPNLEKFKTESIQDGETPVIVQKIITEIYVYTGINDKQFFYGTQTFQDIHLLGQMRMSEAKSLIDGARKKRRRGK